MKPKKKNRMRGRGKIKKQLARKKKNVIDENILKLREEKEREKARRAENAGEKSAEVDSQAPSALKRFF